MVKVNQPPTGGFPTNNAASQSTLNSQEPTQTNQPKGLFQIPPAFLQ